MTEIHHLTLRAALRLNPALKIWRWNPAWMAFNGVEQGPRWAATKRPMWLPWVIYDVTPSFSPTWIPTEEQLREAESCRLVDPREPYSMKQKRLYAQYRSSLKE